MIERKMEPARLWLRDPKDLLYSSKQRKADSVIRSSVRTESDNKFEPPPSESHIESVNTSPHNLLRNPSVIRKNTQSSRDQEMVSSDMLGSEPLPKKRRLLELIDYNDNHHLPNETIISTSNFNTENIKSSSKPTLFSNCDMVNGTSENTGNWKDKIEKTSIDLNSHSAINNNQIINNQEDNKLIQHSADGNKRLLSPPIIETPTSSNTETTTTAISDQVPTTISAKFLNQSKTNNTNEETNSEPLNCVMKRNLSCNQDTPPPLPPKMTINKFLTSKNAVHKTEATANSNKESVSPAQFERTELETSIDEFQDILAKACNAVGLNEGLVNISDTTEEINVPTSIHSYEMTKSTKPITNAMKERKQKQQAYQYHLNKHMNHPTKYINYGNERLIHERNQIPVGNHLSNRGVQTHRGRVPFHSENHVQYHYPYSNPYQNQLIPHSFPKGFPVSPEVVSKNVTYPYPDPYYYYRYPQNNTITYPRSTYNMPPQGNRYPWPGATYPSPTADPAQMHLYYRYPTRPPSLPYHQATPTTESSLNLKQCRFESPSYAVPHEYPSNIGNLNKYPIPSTSSSQETTTLSRPKYYQSKQYYPQTGMFLRPPSLSPQGYPLHRAEYSPLRSPISPATHTESQALSTYRTKGNVVDGSPHCTKSTPTNYPIAPVPVKYSEVAKHEETSGYKDDQISHYSRDIINGEAIENGYNKSVIEKNVNKQGPFIIEKVRQYSCPPYQYSDWEVPTHNSSTEHSMRNGNGAVESQLKSFTTYPNHINKNLNNGYSQYHKNIPYKETQTQYNHQSQSNVHALPTIYSHHETQPQTLVQNNSSRTHKDTSIPNVDVSCWKQDNASSALVYTTASVSSHKSHSSNISSTSTTQMSSSFSNSNGLKYRPPVTNLSKSYPVSTDMDRKRTEHYKHYTSETNSNNYTEEKKQLAYDSDLSKSNSRSSSSNDTVPHIAQIRGSHQNHSQYTTISPVLNTSQSNIDAASSLTSLNSSAVPSNVVNLKYNKTLPQDQELIYNYNQGPSPAKINEETPMSVPHYKSPVNFSAVSHSLREVEDLSKKTLPLPGEISIGPFILNKGYATFTNQSEEENDLLLFKQKLLPVIDHLLSIPEATNLRSLRDSPDELLDHLVQMWGGKGANSTSENCYQRMKENFVTVVQHLFKPHLLMLWGWDKAPPEQILDELLNTSEQDHLSHMSFGDLSTQINNPFLPLRRPSFDDDVFLPTTNFACNDLSEDVLNYFEDMDKPTISPDSVLTPNNDHLENLGSPSSFLFKNVDTNKSSINSDTKSDSHLSYHDRENDNSVVKSNINLPSLTKHPLCASNSVLQVIDKVVSKHSENEIQPNLDRVVDMIPCILKENSNSSCNEEEFWNTKIGNDNYSYDHYVRDADIKPDFCSKQRSSSHDFDKYACDVSNQIHRNSNSFISNEACHELGTKNMKRPSLEDVEKTLINDPPVSSASTSTTDSISDDNGKKCNSTQNNFKKDIEKADEKRKTEWQELTEQLMEFKQSKQYQLNQSQIIVKTSKQHNGDNNVNVTNRDMHSNLTDKDIKIDVNKVTDNANSELTECSSKEQSFENSLNCPKDECLSNKKIYKNNSGPYKPKITAKEPTLVTKKQDMQINEDSNKSLQSGLNNIPVIVNKSLINEEKKDIAIQINENKTVLSTSVICGKTEADILSNKDISENKTKDLPITANEKQTYSQYSTEDLNEDSNVTKIPIKECTSTLNQDDYQKEEITKSSNEILKKDVILNNTADDVSFTTKTQNKSFSSKNIVLSESPENVSVTNINKTVTSKNTLHKDLPVAVFLPKLADSITYPNRDCQNKNTLTQDPEKEFDICENPKEDPLSTLQEGNSHEIDSIDSILSKKDETKDSIHLNEKPTTTSLINLRNYKNTSQKSKDSLSKIKKNDIFLKLQKNSNSKNEFVKGLSPVTDYTTIFKKYVESKMIISDAIENETKHYKIEKD